MLRLPITLVDLLKQFKGKLFEELWQAEAVVHTALYQVTMIFGLLVWVFRRAMKKKKKKEDIQG